MAPKDPSEGHNPNLTVSSPNENTLPRDPNQAVHKKPRVFIHRPNEDPNAEPQAYQDTSVITAMRTIQTEDFTLDKLGKMPCFRQAMLPAIGGGVGLGVVRFVAGGSVFAAGNWIFGGTLGISLVTYNYCQRQRRIEKDNVRQAVKVLDEKQKLKDAEVAAAKKAEEEKRVFGKTSGANFWSTFKFW